MGVVTLTPPERHDQWRSRYEQFFYILLGGAHHQGFFILHEYLPFFPLVSIIQLVVVRSVISFSGGYAPEIYIFRFYNSNMVEKIFLGTRKM